MSLNQRLVARIPGSHKSVTAFFDPAVEVARRNPVGPLERRILRFQNHHFGILIHDHLWILRQRVRVGPVIVIEFRRIILHNQHAAIFHIIQKSSVVRFHILPRSVSSHSQHYRIVGSQVPCRKLFGRESMNADTQVFKRPRHFIAGSFDVTDAETGRNFEVHACNTISGRLIEIVRFKARIADPLKTASIFLPVRFSYRRYRIGFMLQVSAVYPEIQCLALAVPVKGKSRR